MEASGQLHAPAALPLYPLDRRLGGPQRRLGRGGEARKSQALLLIQLRSSTGIGYIAGDSVSRSAWSWIEPCFGL
jgi:hypothetical protein